MEELLYGAAYYDEYMPFERLEKDVKMLKQANMNLVRIAESTWSTLEPEDGVFDFHHIDRVLNAMGDAGIHVIVGTPTYAVPSWMTQRYPDILVTTKGGRRIYGARQIMDITNKAYLFYCERVIRRLMEHVKDHPAVIGYQIDNETKHFGTASENVQRDFVVYLKEKFHGDVEEMNREFGLNYWSNAVHSWEDFPDVRGTINGSLGGEFERFQRRLVTDFLGWQAGLVREYKREDQFITHNFDFGWKDGSYGVQPDVDHFQAAKCLDITGCDIYHPSQDRLTGAEAAFGGDLARSLKQDNYFVLETQAQGFPQWTPYDGQLRLLAFSHLASGADMVEYWHWHSLHNACETYWKGVLSHDFGENRTYREAVAVGADFRRLGKHLIHLKKENKAAILVSNEALTGLNWFPLGDGRDYNDVVRWIYDALYQMNVECDFIFPEAENLSDYKVIFMPALYCASEALLRGLKDFVREGGVLVGTFKSCFANENVKVYSDAQPHILQECFGAAYDQFFTAEEMPLEVLLEKYSREDSEQTESARGFMECLRPQGARVLARYSHSNWGQYAAAVCNDFGRGAAYYLGCMCSSALLKRILKSALDRAEIKGNEGSSGFPVIIRKGINRLGREIVYMLNYSGESHMGYCPRGTYRELLLEKQYSTGETILLEGWGMAILEKEE
ncbi:MAG: beta-galactosidase [Lachnospiraceae bacterium]|nr:beta-galactosidase [Lachnospiraceae bacterium]